MKYQAPFDRPTEPDASYLNGNPQAGIQGSIPPAAAFEYPMREIVNVITKNNFVPTDNDLLQMVKANRSQYVNFAEDTGSVDTMSVAFDPPISSYTLGLPIRVRARETSTGPATIDAGGGRVPIIKPNGDPIDADDITAGGMIDLVYDGTNFQMINFLGQPDTAGSTYNYNYSNIPYCVDTSTTANVIVAPFAPAITTLAAGQAILVKVSNTVTGATTITVNALSAQPVVAQGTEVLVQGDIIAGDVVLMVYDGTNFYIYPDVIITNNVTINVPSQYATTTLALAALRRKLIAPTATVTIQLATGSHPPFVVNHPNADRIVIQGTMLAAAPVGANFTRTGNDLTSRINNGGTNLVMMRSRYGTEIDTGGGGIAIQSLSPTAVRLKDLLLVDGAVTGIGVSVDMYPGIVQAVVCDNIACYGFAYGFFGGGRMRLINCWMTYCSNGVLVTNGGSFHISGGGAFGCVYGYYGNNGSQLILSAPIYSQYNGQIGVFIGNVSYCSVSGLDSQGNGLYDAYSSVMSYLITSGSVIGTFSPTPGYFGNYNALITVT